ncbi:MAG: ABC transporter substrate-binding protein [Anaerolineales bacterium]|nr:ABC transporter substrate-binding protein [Anaerolineales bacterium]
MRRAAGLFSMLVVAAMLLGACGPAATPTAQVIKETVEVPVEVTSVPGEVEVVRINVGYVPDPQFAPLYVGVEKGYFAQEGLQIVIDYATTVDGVELLSAGKIQFSLSGGDQLIQARSQGRPLVQVLRWYNGMPSAIFSLAETGIEGPEDLKGKTVGIPGMYGLQLRGWMALLEANGLTSEDVTLEAIGYTQMSAVTEGLVDAAIGYSNNEPVQMAFHGQDINVIEMAPYVHFPAIGVITTEDMIAKNPELVQKFVRAFLKSVKATVDDPAFALDAVVSQVAYSGGDALPLTEATLNKAIEFWTPIDGKYGFINMADYEWSQAWLLEQGQMDQEVDLSKAFTNEFVENAQP